MNTLKRSAKQIIILSMGFLSIYYTNIFFQKNENLIANDYDKLADSSSKKYYFSGKTIEWIIPFKEGGGGDAWARFNAPFFQKHIPGNPVIIVNNIPGGGSIKGANIFAERVKPDGLMILGTSGTTQMPFLLEDPRVHYDYQNYKPIMAYPTGGVAYISSDILPDKFKNMKVSNVQEQLEKTIQIIRHLIENNIKMKYGSQGPTSLDLVTLFSFDLLGLDVQAVFGFRGRGAGRLAFERGEVEVDYQTSTAYLKNSVPLVEEGKAIPLFSFGSLDKAGNLVRDASFQNSPVGIFDGDTAYVNVPHFGEVYEKLGNKLSGIKWDTWFAFMSAGFGGMKLLLTPKETPDEIVKEFHKGIHAMKSDSEYLEKKIEALGEYEQLTGEGAEKIFTLATQVNSREKKYMKDWLGRKFKLNIPE